MAIIINKEDILSIVDKIDVVAAMEKGFIEYSNGNVVVPPVGELLFDNPKGDAHIKYGYIKGSEFYCIKIASGFYDNPKLGISSSQGLMLLFNQKTGVPVAVLLDDGELTNIRTAAAGALAAKYFAPKSIKAVGIIGTGIQGRLQLKYLQNCTAGKSVWIWDRSIEAARGFKKEMESESDLNIAIAKGPSEVAGHCNLIVTTTPSETPLLNAEDVQPGTHITAVGSDTSEKQELSGMLVQKADLIITDSIEQSKSRGEIFRAAMDGVSIENRIEELGRAIQKVSLQRSDDKQISIVDLTGVAVQDIMIATAVYKRFINTKN